MRANKKKKFKIKLVSMSICNQNKKNFDFFLKII